MKLRWTAPGDDGYVGRASRYEIRYQFASAGPLDTETEWKLATSIRFVPIPSPAGYRDSTLATGLVAGAIYYFAIRTYDEASNESQLSNSPHATAIVQDCCHGLVGDVNGDGSDEPTLQDAATLVDHLFLSQTVLWCAAEADINQSGGPNPLLGPNGDVTLTDLAILIDYLFISGPSKVILPSCQ